MTGTDPSSQLLDRAIYERFRFFGAKLGVRVESPFVLLSGDERVGGLIFLPHFGCPNGLIAVPYDFKSRPAMHQDIERRANAGRLLENSGVFLSIVSIDSWRDEQDAIDRLGDWQYFGPNELKPAWYTGIPGGHKPADRAIEMRKRNP